MEKPCTWPLLMLLLLLIVAPIAPSTAQQQRVHHARLRRTLPEHMEVFLRHTPSPPNETESSSTVTTIAKINDAKSIVSTALPAAIPEKKNTTKNGKPEKMNPIVSQPLNPDEHDSAHPSDVTVAASTSSSTTSSSSSTTTSSTTEAPPPPTVPPKEEIIRKNLTYPYYNASLIVSRSDFDAYWSALSKSNFTVISEFKKTHTMKMLTPSFPIPYFGINVSRVTPTNGGFAYMDEVDNDWARPVCYVAPLKAEYDLTANGVVKYADNGTAFVIVWEDVSLANKSMPGNFTFSLVLKSSGEIEYAFKGLPYSMAALTSASKGAVNVGIGDGILSTSQYPHAPGKNIYGFSNITLTAENIGNNTLVFLKPRLSCPHFTMLETCVNQSTSFKCVWCEAAKMCSNGADRHVSDWVSKGCLINNSTSMKTKNETGATTDEVKMPIDEDGGESVTVVVVLILVSLVIGGASWVIYAYRNPHTFSGQLLIKYRPTQWSWGRGEARYTAATIHM